MKVRALLAVVCIFCFSVSRCSRSYAWPVVYPTGTTLYAPDKAYNCYTLFAPLGLSPEIEKTPYVYLINMSGEVVHKWTVPYPPVSYRLLPNGHLVITADSMENTPGRPGVGNLWMGGVAGWLMELDWDGKVVFKHHDLNMHHDFARLDNGHYIYMAWEPVPGNLRAKVLGGLKGSEHPEGLMFNDVLIEIDGQGQLVWKWHANEHLDPKIDMIGPMFARKEWCHGNSLNIMADGNILVTSRSLDCLFIIEKKTGRIIHRWGPPSYVDPATGRIEQRYDATTLHGPHDAKIIPPDCPGAGNILVYDNRATTGDYFYSRVVEIDGKTGHLVSKDKKSFLGRRQFSDFLGSAQKLPNGNIAVCDGADGDFYQMTPDNTIVWEYINPYMPSERLRGAVFRTESYAPDYCEQFKALLPAKGQAVLAAQGNAKPSDTLPGAPETPAASGGALPVSSLDIVLGTALIASVIALIFQSKKRSQ